MYMLARHGDSSLTDSLDMITKLNQEPRDAVWGLMLRVLAGAAQLTEGHAPSEKKLRQLRIHLAEQGYTKLGWDNQPKDDPNTQQLRHTMIALMVGGEDKSAINQALEIFTSAKNLEAIPAEIRNTVLAVAVRHGKSSYINLLKKAYASSNAELQHDITGALASTKKPDVAQKVIEQALGPKGFVRSQDVMRWLALFLRNHHVREVMWEFMIENWKWLAQTLEDSKAFDYLPTYAAAVISTPDWAQKYEKLFKPLLKNKTLERNIRIGLADIEARVAWRKRDEAAIQKWLATLPNKEV
jgi:aminopeptidase N